MPRSLHLGSIVPPGLVVDHIEGGAGLTITARPTAASARCPRCDGISSRVHSRYIRTLSDHRETELRMFGERPSAA